MTNAAKSYDELKALIEQRGVHAVFGAPGEGLGIEQNAHELAQFLVEMQTIGVQSVLEIGTGYKAGLARFLHDDMGWEVVSVDIHDYGHLFTGITFLNLDEALNLLMFGNPDLVIIDGNHSYEGVKADHERWGTLARKVVMFHDIAGLRDCEGVKRYWFKTAYYETMNLGGSPKLKPGYHEIIAAGDQRGGVGWIDLATIELEYFTETAKVAAIKPAAFPKTIKKATTKK